MMCPPLVLRIRHVGPGHRGMRLWLPLFLIWPVVAALALLAAPVALVVLIAKGRFCHVGQAVKVAPGVIRVICSLRGTRVQVATERQEVDISAG